MWETATGAAATMVARIARQAIVQVTQDTNRAIRDIAPQVTPDTAARRLQLYPRMEARTLVRIGPATPAVIDPLEGASLPRCRPILGLALVRHRLPGPAPAGTAVKDPVM
jgi:hypothetical protein